MDRRTAIPKLIETNIRLMKFCLFEEKATAERIWLFLDDDMLVTGLSASLQCKVYQIQKKTFSKVCKNTEISSTENREMSKITWPYGGFIHRASVNYYPADFCQWISLMQWTFEKQVILRFYSMYAYSGIRSIRHALSSWPSGATSFLLNIGHFCLLVYAVVLSFIYEGVSLSLTL